MININHYYQSEKSKFLIIKGADRKKFLQGLISNDIYKLEPQVGIYSALLTPKGKFLFDFFLVEQSNTIFLECASDKIESLKLKLKIYKLRSNVEIETFNEKQRISTSYHTSINFMGSFRKNKILQLLKIKFLILKLKELSLL